MRKSNNDSGLTAKRSNRLLAAGLTVLTVFVVSCASSQLPVDDAYYWSEKSPITNNQSPKEPTPSVEFTNVQDTTVTIRIHK